MLNCAVPSCGSASGPGATPLPGLATNVLLVSRSPDWTRAVSQAVATIGGLAVRPCAARDALTRLAGVNEHVSHLLVDEDSAEGLLDALIDLTVEATGLDSAALMLGGSAPVIRPHIAVIHSASTSAVREALMPRPPVDGPSDGAMQPTELRDALAGSMIEARYQPIVRMADRRPMALEALARLNHPQRGTLLPDRFVPQIEDAGLAGELTELVSACAFADMTRAGIDGTRLSITLNFPLDVLLRPEALVQLELQRRAAGLAVDRVVVELTESRPVQDFIALRRPLEHLRTLGYRVAIDDVGPAVPDLAQLLDLPFTSVKLDKDLVQHLGDRPAVEAELTAIIAQAHARGLTVVAEGVESTAIWDRIKALGADEAQGFLVARPLPIAAVPVWLESWLGEG
jgi:EAL domain-containing protein (putative c-di-GMP-specific phosphodiesterase class I)